MDQELLRRRNNLITSGTGVIALGVWSVLKTMMFVILRRDEIPSDITDDLSPFATMVVFIVLLLVFSLIAFSVNLYIGRSAIKEGMGEKKGRGYLILAVLLTAVTAAELVWNIVSIPNPETIIPETIALVIIDITILFTLMDMLRSVAKSRKLAALIEEGEEPCS